MRGLGKLFRLTCQPHVGGGHPVLLGHIPRTPTGAEQIFLGHILLGLRRLRRSEQYARRRQWFTVR